MDLQSSLVNSKVEALKEVYRRNTTLFFEQQLKIKIKAPGSPVIPFAMWPHQRRRMSYINHCKRNGKPVRIIDLKPRQAGLSSFYQGIAFKECSLNRNTNSLTLAHDLATAETLHLMGKTYYENCSPIVRPARKYTTKRELVFESEQHGHSAETSPGSSSGLGSRMMVHTANNANVGAAHTLQIVIMSEFGRYMSIDDIRESLMPAVPYLPGTYIIIESTARGAGTDFHDEWERAIAGESGFQYFFTAWYEIPEYQLPVADGEMDKLDAEEEWLTRIHGCTKEQLKWRREKIREMGSETLFRQSYPTNPQEAWLSSGDPVFDTAIMKELYETLETPRFVGELTDGRFICHWENHDEIDGYLCVWEKPERGLMYDVGGDIALGIDGGDFTNFVVIERKTKRVVANWHGLVDPFPAARVVAEIGNYYNVAQVCIEINGIGFATNAKLCESYANVYRWRHRDEAVPKLTKKTGWETSPTSKRYLVGLTRTILREDKPALRSKNLWDEMCNFVHYGEDRFAASPAYHDDQIMSLMIAYVAADDETDHWSRNEGPVVHEEKPDPVNSDTEWESILEGKQERSFYDL